MYNICRVIINKQFKKKHYESKTNIIRRITNYSLLGSIFYNNIFYFIVMKNNIKLKGDVALVNKDELIETEVKYQEPKQDKKMYSEEEVEIIITKLMNDVHCGDLCYGDNVIDFKLSPRQWLEQFKKK